MTLAKRIGDGSVSGRVNMFDCYGLCWGTAVYNAGTPGNIFTIIPNRKVDDTNPHEYAVRFNDEGKSTGDYDRNKYHLEIEIPVGEENCNADSVTEEKDSHYHKCGIEPIEYILANNLGFCEGNIVKYITRYKDKGKPLDDLRKIKVYVDYLIDELTRE